MDTISNKKRNGTERPSECPKKSRDDEEIIRLADTRNYDYDSDYDDLDDMVTPSDIENFDFENEDSITDEDDCQSTNSSNTTCSVGSNTPSLIGENLESFSLGESNKNEIFRKNQECKMSSLPPLRKSLFPFVPPSIQFFHHDTVSEVSLPPELRKQLKWKLSNITPAVIKRIVTNSGFRLMRKNAHDWSATWGNHTKSASFKSISESSKINHFPGTFNIGRKDRLWKNYHALKLKFGKEEFSFLPRTFCLPQDTKLLRKVWEKRGGKEKWILKPPALSRGSGIRVVHRWSEVPKTPGPLIVQKYISKPHLINDTKYDLRIYVLLTSIHPLRLYLFDEGLVRFASNKYTPDSKTLSDVYMHLTNYSINKNSSNYIHNDNSEARQGHKWTLRSLWSYFKEQGLEQKSLWSRIKDLIIKTIISAEDQILKLIKSNLRSHYSAFELFGFDVLLDASLKPWLIEVNISPSLHSASPLDLDVKSALATEMFNIVRFHVPAKLSKGSAKEFLNQLGMSEIFSLVHDKRLYTRDLSKVERLKQESFTGEMNRNAYLDSILEKLTADDIRILIRSEDELTQVKHFERIFPTSDSHYYFKYFKSSRYYNRLLDAWECKYSGTNRSTGISILTALCEKKIHLQGSSLKKNNNNIILNVSMLKAPTGNVTETVSLPSSDKVKVGKVAVTVKPLGVKSGCLLSSSTGIPRKIPRNAFQPQPMSTESEQSRSPSPNQNP